MFVANLKIVFKTHFAKNSNNLRQFFSDSPKVSFSTKRTLDYYGLYQADYENMFSFY